MEAGVGGGGTGPPSDVALLCHKSWLRTGRTGKGGKSYVEAESPVKKQYEFITNSNENYYLGQIKEIPVVPVTRPALIIFRLYALWHIQYKAG